jgi:hypothetical protein
MKKNVASLHNLLMAAALLAVIMTYTGCQSDYRTKSVIDTRYTDSTPWQKTQLITSPINILSAQDPFMKESYMNPYTYNPADTFDNKHGAFKSTWQQHFKDWFTTATNVTDANAIKIAAKYELFEPMYLKATLSTNMTGLSDNDRKYYRNALQDALIQVMKESTVNHLSALKAGDTRNNLIMGDAALALSGGAAVTSGALAKALAASATGAQGARALFNDQVFRNTLLESIIALIQKDQADFYESIRTNWQAKSIYDYSMEAAITDAKEYETRGSFYNGLALLQKAVQNQVSGIKNIVPINQLVSTEITSPSTLQINISTNASSNVTTNTFALSGQGLTQLDVGAILNSSNKVATVASITVGSDLKAQISLINTATNNATDILPLPLLNGKGHLSIPVSVSITNAPANH